MGSNNLPETAHVVTDTGIRAIDPWLGMKGARAYVCSCGAKFCGVFAGASPSCPEAHESVRRITVSGPADSDEKGTSDGQ